MHQDTMLNCQSKKGDFASPSAQNHYRPNSQIEPIHSIINLNFDLKEFKCSGSVTQRIRANVNNDSSLKLNALNFRLFDVRSFDPSTKESFDIVYHYDGSIITISWNKSWKAGEIRDVEVSYEVIKPIAGLNYSYPNLDQPDKPIYVGADHETEKAQYWLPCVDHPSIRTTLEFFLTSDSNHTILANGKLVDEKITGDKKTAHWVLDFPCPSYLTTICIGDLVTYDDRDADAGNGLIEVKYFTTKKYSANDLKLSFDKTPKMLEWMNKKLGVPLPYPKYYQYALPHHGGAMENISLVSWDDFHVLDEVFSKERSWSVDQTNVHEMAHSWFGDAVVIKDFAHAWMKESWATYMETVWLEDMVSQEEAQYDRFYNERRYKNETKRYVRPIVTNKYDSSWDMFDGHLYPGGSQRLDMLRKLVGDQAFWAGVTDYLQTYKGNVAETSDFQRKIEKHSGLNLQQFFDQWYYSKGYPALKVSYKFDEKNSLIELKVKQTQVDKEKGVGIFEFPLEIRFEFDDNNFLDFTFSITDEEHVFYTKSSTRPIQVIIDEKHKILMDIDFNPGTEMLKRIIQTGSMKNKILAIAELSKSHGTDETIDFLASEYGKQTFWGLKNEIINEIGSIYNVEATNTLLTILNTERDPLVVKELLQTLQNIPLTDEVVKAVQNYLETSEILYLAHGNALKLLGLNREKSAEMFTYLRNYSPNVDKKGILSSSRRIAIGKLRTKESIEFLKAELARKDIFSTEIPSLISALVESALWAEQKDIEIVKNILVDKLKTETLYAILRSTCSALIKFEDPSLNRHILKIKSKAAFQEYPMIDRLVEKNKGKTSNEELKNLDEKVKKIEKENLELKEKINKLEKMLEK